MHSTNSVVQSFIVSSCGTISKPFSFYAGREKGGVGEWSQSPEQALPMTKKEADELVSVATGNGSWLTDNYSIIPFYRA